MRIGLAPYECRINDIEFNLSQIEKALKESGNADLVCFGEAFLQGFGAVTSEYEEDIEMAVEQDSSAMNRIKELSVKYQKGNAITESVAVAFETTINEMQNFAEVAKSTNESVKSQAEALSQIEAGIEQISGVTQNTAASTQESSAISEQLADRAAELDQLVKKFKLYSPGK